MFSSKSARLFGFLFLLMLALRIGYKYYRSQQPPAAEAQMAKALDRQAALVKAIEADQETQRASGAPVVLADSAVLTADTVSPAK